jgi:hypothetical protein
LCCCKIAKLLYFKVNFWFDNKMVRFVLATFSGIFFMWYCNPISKIISDMFENISFNSHLSNTVEFNSFLVITDLGRPLSVKKRK